MPIIVDTLTLSTLEKQAGVDKVVYTAKATGVVEVVDPIHAGDVFEDTRTIDLDANGKERPIETEKDYALRLISLEDDSTLPIFTFRMWFLSLGLSCFGAVLGQLFYFRPQSVFVSVLFLQILAYIIGKILERFVPGPGATTKIKTRDNKFWRFMNPGPFNIKEHVAITIMASTASNSSLAITIFAAQDLYYNVKPSVAVGIFTLIGSQLIGYGLAGMVRLFLVYPTWAVYPQLVPTVQLFDALHRGQGIFLQKKRLKFFWFVFLGIFIWEWFPEYIAPTLTGVSIFCLANQKSAWFTRVFGGAAGNEGLGILSLSFDWNYVGSGGNSIGSLFTPLAAQLSLYAGCVICIISFCACYALNVLNAANLPFLSQLLFYSNGTQYDQLSILNDDFTLNPEKLAVQGLPWYATSNVLNRVSKTMTIGAAITHFFLWHFKTVWNIVSTARTQECDDLHYQKMKAYEDVPWWWYAAIFVSCVAIALGTSYGADSGMPWWALFIALAIATMFLPIMGTLYCTVGYDFGIENLVQMVGAAILPGRPVANMYFTLYGYNTYEMTLSLLRDLKLGQYTKLPPRVTFIVQIIGSVVGGLLNYVIMESVISGNRQILLEIQGNNVWSGQAIQAYNSEAVTWGALAKLLYAPGARYGFVPWMLIVGLGVPIPTWILHRFYPKVGWNKVFTPIMVAELGYFSIGINSSVFSSFLVAILSQWYLRKYRPRWFRKYNFLLSAALDGGTQVMVFVWSFAVGGASGDAIPFPNWALNPVGNPDHCLRLT